MHPETTVFVVDDDPAVRDSLALLLNSVGLHCECFGSATQFLEECNGRRPGCLILDVRMAGMNGLELQARLVERELALPIVMISGHADVPTAVSALKQGAIDFLEKPFRDQDLLDRVQAAIKKDRAVRIARARYEDVQKRVVQLTPREREVLRLVVAGHTNAQIGERLEIATKTVEAHRARVMKKMGAGSVAELTQLALLAADPRWRGSQSWGAGAAR